MVIASILLFVIVVSNFVPVTVAALSVSTGRSSYAPPQTVEIAGSGAGFLATVNIEIKDPNNVIVFANKVTAGFFGGFSDSYALSTSATLGTYTIIATSGSQSQTTFQVKQATLGTITIDRATYPPGARVHLMIVDPDQGETVRVTATSTSDPTGWTGTVSRTGDGVYSGAFPLGGYTSFPQLKALRGDTITVTYEDDAPPIQVSASATIVTSSGSTTLDKTNYLLTAHPTITVTDPDMNLDSLAVDKVTVRAQSTSDPNGFLASLTESGSNTGIFASTGKFGFTSGFSKPPLLSAKVGDTFTMTYTDSMDASGQQTVVAASASIVPATIKVSVDQTNYVPGSIVSISGTLNDPTSGNAPIGGATISLKITRPDNVAVQLSGVITDSAGQFGANYQPQAIGSYTVSASYAGTTATVAFTVKSSVLTVFTDKLTYAPGDSVTISGTANSDSLVALKVTNPDGTDILLVTASADSQGKYSRTFKIPSDSIEGTYSVTASEGGLSKTTTFQVVVISLTVSTDKLIYVPGDTVTISGTAPANSLVALQTTNPSGTAIMLTTASADSQGKYSRSFFLPSDAVDGTYTVTASTGGVTNTTTFLVTAKPTDVTVVIQSNSTVGSPPLTVQFTTTVSGGTPPYSYKWSFGDGVLSESRDPVHTFSNAGTYSVSLSVTDNGGNTGSSSILTITVTSQKALQVSLQATPSTLSSGEEVKLTATVTASDGSSPSVSYSWVVTPQGGKFSSSTVNPTTWTAPTVQATTSYTITVTASASGYFSGTSSVSVTVTVGGGGGGVLPVKITLLQTLDASGSTTKTNFGKGETLLASATAENTDSKRNSILVIIQVLDAELTPLPTQFIKVDLDPGQDFTFAPSIVLPTDAVAGTWALNAAAFSDFPSKGGIVIAAPLETAFSVT